VKAPLTADGELRLAVFNYQGLMELDAVAVRPVGDRENDALTAFLEGTEQP
jgi:hypothetical protein